jgi:hypothetical protein
MSESTTTLLTQHAMLVAWGEYAQSIGLVKGIEGVPLDQKEIDHSPQRKVIEFLVAILGGLPYLKDISRSAHPLDQDLAVAKAWGQTGWADQSGVSRTLSALTMVQAKQIVNVLRQVSQPFIDREVMLAIRDQGKVVYDGDFTGRPVSNSSTTYPKVAFGHMSDGVALGYQAAMVSFHSPTFGRIWLSVKPHPGDKVACTALEEMVRSAEAQTGVRPWRRTDLLEQRLAQMTEMQAELAAQVDRARQRLDQAHEAQAQVVQQLQMWQQQVTGLDAAYERKGKPERPHSQLAQARHKVDVYARRQSRRAQAVTQAAQHLEKAQARLAQHQAETSKLEQRLTLFEQENAANVSPIRADFRIDAGFSPPENVALLIELGYEVYTKPHGAWLKADLKRQTTDTTEWTRVGKNAKMVAWAAQQVSKCPYPLDVALERFYTGDTLRYSALIHYGQDAVTTDLPTWFHTYNGRQTIEAGIKEGKNVFQMHHLKVRSQAALFLQEHFATFAANLVRWAAHWLVTECLTTPDGADLACRPQATLPGVKAQVQTLAHTSAYVTWFEQGCLLMFTEHSLLAGCVLYIVRQTAIQLALPLFKSCIFAPS